VGEFDPFNFRAALVREFGTFNFRVASGARKLKGREN
jgi:hypothetical protein